MEMKQNEMKSICAWAPAQQPSCPKKQQPAKRARKHHPLSGIPRTLTVAKCRIRGRRWKGLLFANRFRINLCAPFSEIWAPRRRVHDICLDSWKGGGTEYGGDSRMSGKCFSLYLHKIKRIANCEPTIIPCTNSFAALLSLAINNNGTTTIFDKCSQISSENAAKMRGAPAAIFEVCRNFW